MIEVNQQAGASEILKIDGAEYVLVRKGDLPAKRIKLLGRLYLKMQEAMKQGDMDTALTALIECIGMFSTAPPEVLENLTMTQLFQIVAAFNEVDSPAGADAANPT